MTLKTNKTTRFIVDKIASSSIHVLVFVVLVTKKGVVIPQHIRSNLT